jgi:N-acetylmuramoyl-L-alanine amidase
MPGDIVFVPDKSLREESRGTEQRHRFRKKNVPAELVIRIMSGNEPRANEKYSINVDGSWHEGSTDSQGYLRAQIPPGASSAKLFMGGDTDGFELALGQLDPSSEVSGAQARLANLGIYHGEIHGKMDDATVESLRDFQRAHGLQETGKLDKLTQDKLSRVHGS